MTSASACSFINSIIHAFLWNRKFHAKEFI